MGITERKGKIVKDFFLTFTWAISPVGSAWGDKSSILVIS